MISTQSLKFTLRESSIEILDFVIWKGILDQISLIRKSLQLKQQARIKQILQNDARVFAEMQE